MKYWVKGALYGLILGIIAELNFWNMIGGALLLIARPVQKFFYIFFVVTLEVFPIITNF